MLDRGKERILNGPTVPYPVQNSGFIDFKSLAMVGYASSYSGHCVNPVVSLVSCLLGIGSPPTIFWRVVAVWIDPIYRTARRLISHIRNEVGKRIKPSVANLNPPAAVKVIIATAFRVASGFHPTPRVVKRVPPSSARKAMLSAPLANRVPREAATGLSVSTFELIVPNCDSRSAVTHDNTGRSPIIWWFKEWQPLSNHSKSCKFSSRWNNHFRHNDVASLLCLASGTQLQLQLDALNLHSRN